MEKTHIFAEHPGIVRDIRERFERWGTLSPAQIDLVRRLAVASRAAAGPKVPTPIGRCN